ncbi:chromate efflux transporter [Geminicoccus flavidas]|uniref:chromate efflux transporter n=1 Tax=Geminicoccus flavidas TaxID=2506407 RepID=UPI00135716EC|nr:chromate efflux transporter [Geminicoccus flavidas]
MTRHPAVEVLAVFFRLGLTSFGGPIAHLGYFREEFVVRRRWLSEAAYADLVALCQFLPGPASSQVGMGIGLLRAGLPGAGAAWLGFTLPSALLMILFALLVTDVDPGSAGWLRGLKIMAVAVVAQAVDGMARSLCPDRVRASLAAAAAVLALLAPGSGGQLAAIMLGGAVGLLLPREAPAGQRETLLVRIPAGLAAGALLLCVLLLLGLPLLAEGTGSTALAIFDRFYRAGALVFGGGHVVLPLLQSAVVAPGWVDPDQFLAGYAMAQAVPGPLFTFAAYLGAVLHPAPNGIAGGLLCLGAIFLPSFLLVLGTLPFWASLRRRPHVRAVLAGINAAVVGILLAALYDPVWVSSIHRPADFALAMLLFLLLAIWRLPVWLVVATAAAGGMALSAWSL